MSDAFVPPLPSWLGAGADIEAWIFVGVSFALLAIKIFAFVSAILYSAESYSAADKMSKAAWCAILGVGLLIQVVPVPLSLVNLALLVAALVYLADVRPALAGLRRR
ncbi:MULTISPECIES: DUF2516 family protein [unclassified Nocardioides]|uniref:DUF2516 family protein n=1 Tax=unclassified Nocardioides TaxID=2615069 RepID=UPI0011531824|nr:MULTISPECIES: DUF2516 family protein [unclassified Nocardioides]TQK69467.1 uncharacterized protein DUF2516 [Nocardioides sp. SLBN-35]WGY01235.1 DUF2516 family protein [Nocardioides sp. QY071]